MRAGPDTDSRNTRRHESSETCMVLFCLALVLLALVGVARGFAHEGSRRAGISLAPAVGPAGLPIGVSRSSLSDRPTTGPPALVLGCMRLALDALSSFGSAWSDLTWNRAARVRSLRVLGEGEPGGVRLVPCLTI